MKIENGYRKARPRTIRKLAKALNVEPSDVIAPIFARSTSKAFEPTLKEPPRVPNTQAMGVSRSKSSARGELTITVPVSLTLTSSVFEALRSGRELDPNELRELEEAAREQLTAE